MMREFVWLAVALAAPVVAAAQEQRELGAHEHGVGRLNIAIEGDQMLMELEAPGFDIVGFEHPAESDSDRALLEAATARLARPLELFVFPAAAGCEVAAADVETAADGADHDEEHHAGGHVEAAEEEEHAEGEAHSEFHAEYTFTCGDASQLTRIEFVYFTVFPNAQELEIQMISAGGTAGYEVERDAPVLQLGGGA